MIGGRSSGLTGPAGAAHTAGIALTMRLAAVAFPQQAPQLFSAETNAAGRCTVTYRPTEPGTYTFTATGRESGRTASTTVIVLPKKKHDGKDDGKDDGKHLPVTGDSMGTPLKVGGGLVGAGAVLMLGSLVWRRRSRFGMGSTR